jgi:ParB family chromosome partitioning protein
MKANAPKRKVFNDAVDLLTGGETAAAGKGVQMLPVDGIRPFHNHPFRLYEGERLDDMVESVREHGVLVPAIVRTVPGGYEMLAGHNRLNAARLAGLKEIPAIVKEGLPDAEAYVYVIETNMLQRSFNDLSVSERIAVLAERYDKVCGTKKREEILTELQALNGGGGHDVHQQAKSRELLGKELGLTGRHVARYVRCKELIPEFKDMLDDGSLTMVSAVELSYLPEEEQAAVKKVMDQSCIRLKADKAGELRKAAGSLSEGKAQEILGVDRPVKTDAEKPVSVKLPAKLYSRYFTNVAAKDVQGILEAALEQYFEGKGA